jgi:hypothetical protein
MFATLAPTADAHRHPAPAAAALARAGDEVLPAGCGWFDSSLDLSRGLAVVEHAGFDAIGDVAPLGWQLAAWL